MICYLQSMLWFFAIEGLRQFIFRTFFSLFCRSPIYHGLQGFATPGRNTRKKRSQRRRRKLVTHTIGLQGTRNWRSGLLLKTESAPNAREVFCCMWLIETFTIASIVNMVHTTIFDFAASRFYSNFSRMGHPTVMLKRKLWTPDIKIPGKPGDIAGAVLMPWRCPRKGSDPVQLANDWVVCFFSSHLRLSWFQFSYLFSQKKYFWIWAISNIWILVFKWIKLQHVSAICLVVFFLNP